ncbi:MAG TPA: hypothetical protein PK639_01115 [Candidatus Woesebacteria bacterium]|nr:hypothetical protein [Candidatus Woesebacteria bacterium]
MMTAQDIYRKNYQRVSLFVLIISVFIVIVYLIVNLKWWLVFGSPGYDSHIHVGYLKLINSYLNKTPLSETAFPYLLKNDPHLGINFLFTYGVQKIFNLGEKESLLILGSITIFLLFNVLFRLINLFTNNPQRSLIAVILIFVSPNLSGFQVFGSSISVGDLMVTGSYPYLFGSLLVYSNLYILWKYLHTFKVKYLLPLSIIFFFNITSHFLTAVMFLILASLMSVSSILESKNRKLSLFQVAIIFSVLTLVLTICLKWPIFNWLVFFLRSNPIQTSSPPTQWSSVTNYINILSFSLIGYVVIFRNKITSFVSLWIYFFTIISLSFLYPIRIPMFWRFTFLLNVPLSIYLSELFYKNQKTNKILIILIFTGILINSLEVVNLIKSRYNIYTSGLISFIQKNRINKTVAADQYVSYILQSQTDVSVYTLPQNHLFLDTGIIAKKRSDYFINIEESGQNNLWDEFLINEKVDCIVVKKEKSQFIQSNTINTIYVDDYYSLLCLKDGY